MKILLLILVTGFVSSCATTEKYEASLKSWVGSSEDNLIASWGIPSATYKTNDGKLIMYYSDGGARSFSQPVGNMYYTNTVAYWCKTTFIINNSNIVNDWRWEGNNCKSKYFNHLMYLK